MVPPLISDEDLYYLGEGTHLRPFEVLGAHPMSLGEGAQAVAGVRFAVWAPNASHVSVVGDFNAWDGRRHGHQPSRGNRPPQRSTSFRPPSGPGAVITPRGMAIDRDGGGA